MSPGSCPDFAAARHRTRYLAIYELTLEATRRPTLAEALSGMVAATLDVTIGQHRALGLDTSPAQVQALITLFSGVLLTLAAGPPEAVTSNTTGALARCLVAGVLATVPGLPHHPLGEGNAVATQISHVWITSSPDGTQPRSAQIRYTRGGGNRTSYRVAPDSWPDRGWVQGVRQARRTVGRLGQRLGGQVARRSVTGFTGWSAKGHPRASSSSRISPSR